MGCCESHNEIWEIEVKAYGSRIAENQNMHQEIVEEFSDISLDSIQDYHDYKSSFNTCNDFHSMKSSYPCTPVSTSSSFHRKEHELAFLITLPDLKKQIKDFSSAAEMSL
ncbi:unnamed protein product [Blepharisma stoltei]|uniref:Uncharacterized protein n=1 Tax=Blepharisma stoltei TaxID=1481888 RepID=A0AAU9J7R5_9CILI|nr:unnamed protein product [Blepharisma stoltei]